MSSIGDGIGGEHEHGSISDRIQDRINRLKQPLGMQVKRHFTKPDKEPQNMFDWAPRDVSVGKFKATVSAPTSWGDNAVAVMAQKYMRPGETSVWDVVSRVVLATTRWGGEQNYFRSKADCEAFEAELTFLLLDQRWAPNSPVFYNLGTSRKQAVSACYIQSVDDSMEAILQLGVNEGTLFRDGSGSGTNFSSLRSSKEKLSGGGTSSGPVSFERGLDAVAGAIKSAGSTRRAAKIAILDIGHPDILEFIRCKALEEDKAAALIAAGYSAHFDDPQGAYASVAFQNANHSVRVTDAFMRAVEDGRPWTTTEVKTGDCAEVVDARELFREICKAAWRCGDPGLQFHDATNRMHTSPSGGAIRGSNPCCLVGETLVDTNEGMIPIAELHTRTVLPWAHAFDTEAGETVQRRIQKVWIAGETRDLVKVRTHSNTTVRCTEDHRFLLQDGQYVQAKDLVVGAQLRTLGGEPDLVVEVVVQRVEPTAVYDLEVEGIHNFGVGDDVVTPTIVVHNSEYVFIDDSACNLASVNLLKYLDKNDNFDTDGFQHTVGVSILAQEIFVGKAIYPTEKIRANSVKYRTLGLGYANLGALLMSKGLAYDSDDGRNLAAAITALMTGEAYAQSARIARDCGGPFGGYVEADMYRVIQKHSDAAKGLRHNASITDRARKAWHEAGNLGVEVGFRNAQVTLLAPTGTIGIAMGCDTLGIEPDFALEKTKQMVGGGTMSIVNGAVPRALRKLRLTRLADAVESRDLDYILANVPASARPVFDCANPEYGRPGISWRGHVDMMAAVQPFLSGAISKTVNAPGHTTPEEIGEIYTYAWQRELKAISVYRDGCKGSQPLSATAPKVDAPKTFQQLASEPARAYALEAMLESADNIATEGRAQRRLAAFSPPPPVPQRRRMPSDRQSLTHKFNIAGHEGYLTVGLYDDGTPGELFIRLSKTGSAVAGFADAWAVAFSLALQSGVSLEKLCEKFSGMRFEPAGWTGSEKIGHADSVVDYVARWLRNKYVGAGPGQDQAAPGRPAAEQAAGASANQRQAVQPISARVCRDCGGFLVPSGACWSCPRCGTSTGGCS